MTDKANAELADEIERWIPARVDDDYQPYISGLTVRKLREIIAALRRQPSSDKKK